MNINFSKIQLIGFISVLFLVSCDKISHDNHKLNQNKTDSNITPEIKILNQLKNNSAYFSVVKNNNILVCGKVFGKKNLFKSASRIKNKIQSINLDLFFNDGAESVIIMVVGYFDFNDSGGSMEIRSIPVYKGLFRIRLNNINYTYSVKDLFSESSQE
jgi:hypothetical protein